METLATAIMLWLSVNFGLPGDVPAPRIELAAPTHIAALHHGVEAQGVQSTAHKYGFALRPEQMNSVVAVYDRDRQTIYLPRHWTGDRVDDISVLVHELVHYLQDAAELRYECPQAREKLAYEAQDAWLGLFGTDLVETFGIDPFTRLVRTVCGY